MLKRGRDGGREGEGTRDREAEEMEGKAVLPRG